MALSMLTWLVPAKQLAFAANSTANVSPAQVAFRDQILNGICCVPNMSSGYRATKLKDGKSKTHQDGYDTEVSIKEIVFGQLNHKPVAVAVLADWEGGSGIFMSLLLYQQMHGRAVTTGSYAFGDRATLHSLSISNGKIKLVSTPWGPWSEEKKDYPKTVYLTQDDFDKAECIQDAGSKETEIDIARLLDLYPRAFGFFPDSKPLSSEERREALAICKRHENDKEAFANQFRLSLDAAGWRSGPHPLEYDKTGKPILHMENNRANEHSTVDLSADE